MTRATAEPDPRAVRLANELAARALAEPLRPVSRRVQDIAVAVSVAATVLAIVFRLIGGAAASVFWLACTGTYLVVFLVWFVMAVRRGWIDWWGSMVAKPLGRRMSRRVGAAAVGRASVPDGLDLVVLGTAHQTVRTGQWQVFLPTALVLLEAGTGAKDDGVLGAWTWLFTGFSALFTAVLVWTIRRERAAGEVLLAGRARTAEDQPV